MLDTYPAFESTPEDSPIVVILHGITGSSQEAYSRATVAAVTRPKSLGGPGYRAVVLNFRGCKHIILTITLFILLLFNIACYCVDR